MSKNWTPILNRTAGPLYLALADAIVEGILDGTLRPGARLPARRDLAYRLQVSINTVSNAYLEAERRGYVLGQVGSGTYVQAPKADSDIRAWHLGGRPAGLIDLSMCRDCRLPTDEVLFRSAFEQLADDYDHAVSAASRPIIGLDRHRIAGMSWLETLSVKTPLERTIVTNGNSHALLVVLSALAEPGDLVVTEALTNNAVISLASMLHFQLSGLAIDDEGIVPEALEEACKNAPVKVLVTTPNYNNPTCCLMSEERRIRIAEIARRYNIAIVENDPYGPLIENRPPALTALAPELGHYMTTLSKSAACMRTGYLAVPESSLARVTARLRISSWMATTLIAEIAARWIHDGKLETLVAAHREELRARQMILSRVLKDHDVRNFPTGQLAWLNLPEPWRANNYVAEARLKNIAVTPADPFVVGQGSGPQSIRLSVSIVEDHATLEAALIYLRDLLRRTSEPALAVEHI
ncbi:MAG: PLP-dependent aminotransferase family protein [Minwuiales bacterium]|nr:PLP-dependent aminotransferase family protein [Minwuiales bacterium]